MEETRTSSSGAFWRFLATCRDMTGRDRRNSRRATWWLFAWVLTYAGAAFGMRFELIPTGLPGYLVSGLSIVVCCIALLAYIRFVREADELHRKIQLEALALGFGGGFVAAFGLELLQQAGVPNLEIGDLFTTMFVFYMVGLFLGARRYA